MNNKETKQNYMEWFDAEEMHEHSKKWFSELSFIKDEQQFLNNLIKSFAIRPLNKIEFGRVNAFKNDLTENKTRLNYILRQVEKHRNQLEILLDDVNQLEMEKAYKKTHQKLNQKINKYLLDYRTIKERGFVKLASILKTAKEKVALGNPDYQLKTNAKENIDS